MAAERTYYIFKNLLLPQPAVICGWMMPSSWTSVIRRMTV